MMVYQQLIKQHYLMTTKITQTELQCQRIQQDQFDILSYIYLDEFHITKQHTPYKFSILIRPYHPKHQHEYQLNLHFQYTKTYPKTPIKYEIQPMAGITRDNLNDITKRIQDIIYQNRDKPILYDIIQEVRLWIVDFLVEGRAYQTYFQAQKKVQEVFERPKFTAFTPVTVESFNAWKKEFQLKHKKVVKKQTEVKLTGKQWFLGKNEDQIQESEEEQSDEEFEEEEEENEVKNYEEPENKLFMMDEEETAEHMQ